jgi:hypothetical protein
VYASAYIIQPSTNLPCSYYNNTASYVSASGQTYSIICGAEFGGGVDMVSYSQVPSKKIMCPSPESPHTDDSRHGRLHCQMVCTLGVS